MFENIRLLFYKNLDLVLQGDDDDIIYTTTVKHRIQLTDEQPVYHPNRRIPPSKYDYVKQLKRKLLDIIIRESTSPYASQIVLIRKRDNSLRLFVDYCIFGRHSNSSETFGYCLKYYINNIDVEMQVYLT